MADNKDYWSSVSDQGSIKISEDVVASIAAIAATETAGVSALCSGIGTDIAEFLGKKNLSKGVKVQFSGESVELEICFLAKYGYSICDIAKSVQQAVRSSIESMTGLKTAAVNIHVNGVTFEQPDKNAAQPSDKPSTDASDTME